MSPLLEPRSIGLLMMRARYCAPRLGQMALWSGADVKVRGGLQLALAHRCLRVDWKYSEAREKNAERSTPAR